MDLAECDRARLARDPAYDGRVYTGVNEIASTVVPQKGKTVSHRSQQADETEGHPGNVGLVLFN